MKLKVGSSRERKTGVTPFCHGVTHTSHTGLKVRLGYLLNCEKGKVTRALVNRNSE